jgi:hypothetical protein
MLCNGASRRRSLCPPFFSPHVRSVDGTLLSTAAVAGLILCGVAATLLISLLLSRTVLRGQPLSSC